MDEASSWKGFSAEGVLLACCPINVTEVFMGMRPSEAAKTEAFLASLGVLPCDLGGRQIRRRTLSRMATKWAGL